MTNILSSAETYFRWKPWISSPMSIIIQPGGHGDFIYAETFPTASFVSISLIGFSKTSFKVYLKIGVGNLSGVN